MSELRQDPTTGAWVIVAPERGRRPHEWAPRTAADADDAPHRDCPFCPGNEALLPEIIEQTHDDAPPGWLVRVVPNKYPLLAGGGAPRRHRAGAHVTIDGRGRHEVVIESPRHDAELADLTGAELRAAVGTYHRRYVALSALDGVAAVVPFRNRGRRAGASLPHPHAQIVGLGVAPPTLRAMSAHGRARFRATGNCATCMELAAEIEDGTRVVEATGSFVALVPFAATGPFELHIAPRRHVASFGDTLPEELADFALLLGRSLRRLRAAVGDAAWRFAIESAGPGGRDAPYLHWRLRLVPELATPGGFELGTGFAVNPSLPEADAEVLRGAEPSLTTPQ